MVSISDDGKLFDIKWMERNFKTSFVLKCFATAFNHKTEQQKPHNIANKWTLRGADGQT